MFMDLIEWPITSDRLQWHGRHVLRDLDDAPHLFFRLTITGTHFPERGAEPFMRVGRWRSRFVRIADDGLSAEGYFDHRPPLRGVVEFGYAHRVYLRCPRGFTLTDVGRLRRALLPPNVRHLDRFAELLEP